MDYEEMKLECLRLAIESGAKGSEAITLAKQFYDHCRGRGEGVLKTTKPDDLIGGGKARVVGKDNDISFQDYKPE